MATPSTSVVYKHGQHPNSRKNLKPFPPGVNGNPHPGHSLTLAIKDALRKPLKRPSEDAPVRDHIVYATLAGAINCEPTSAHLKEVWDRVEGKVPERHAIIGNILIEVVYRDKRRLTEGSVQPEVKPLLEEGTTYCSDTCR